MQHRVARDASVVHQYFHRAKCGLNLRDTRFTRGHVSHVPGKNGNPGARRKRLCGLLVAAVVGGHTITRGEQRFGCGGSDTGGAARDQGDSPLQTLA